MPGTARGQGTRPRWKPSRHDWYVPSRRISASLCSHARQGGRWPQARRAVATPIARPATTAACTPCGAGSSVGGRQAAAGAIAVAAATAAATAAAATEIQSKWKEWIQVLQWRTFPFSKGHYRSIYLSVFLSIYRSIDLPIYPSKKSIYRSIHLSVCLFIYLSIQLATFLSSYLYWSVTRKQKCVTDWFASGYLGRKAGIAWVSLRRR